MQRRLEAIPTAALRYPIACLLMQVLWGNPNLRTAELALVIDAGLVSSAAGSGSMPDAVLRK